MGTGLEWGCFQDASVLFSKHNAFPFSPHGFYLLVWIQLVRSTRRQTQTSHFAVSCPPPIQSQQPGHRVVSLLDLNEVPCCTQLGERALCGSFFRILAGPKLPGSQRKVPDGLSWSWRDGGDKFSSSISGSWKNIRLTHSKSVKGRTGWSRLWRLASLKGTPVQGRMSQVTFLPTAFLSQVIPTPLPPKISEA